MTRRSPWFVGLLVLMASMGCGGSQAAAKSAYASGMPPRPVAAPAGRAEQYATISTRSAGQPVSVPSSVTVENSMAVEPPRPAPAPASSGGYAEAESLEVGTSGAPAQKAPPPPPPPPVPPGAPGQTTAQAAAATQTQKAPPPDKNLLLIYTANVNLAVFEATKGLDQVETLARDMGGYLVRRTYNQIVVRVPAPKFNDALEAISKVGDELYRDVSVQDVTAQFHDLQIQLGNLLAMRDRLQKLLDMAKDVNEALRVEQELSRVTGQIEQIKGQLKLMSELTAYSTISVTFQAQPVEQVASTVKLPFPWLDSLGLSNLLQL